MSDFNPGDILTISTASYQGRRFTVAEVNGHRTKLRGPRCASRVLVLANAGWTATGCSYSIHEDDGEKNRGRPCTVDDVEPAPKRQEPVLVKPDIRRHRPITAMQLAMLMKCETAGEVAGWAMDRDVSHACVTNDRHAADNAAAMKLYLASLEVRRLSAEAGDGG